MQDLYLQKKIFKLWMQTHKTLVTEKLALREKVEQYALQNNQMKLLRSSFAALVISLIY